MHLTIIYSPAVPAVIKEDKTKPNSITSSRFNLLRKRSHRIPQRQDDRLIAKDLPDLSRQEARVDDGLVDELVQPGVGHDEPAPVASGLAPAVLHAPAHGVAGGLVDMDGREDHGVGHGALAGTEPIGFGQGRDDGRAPLLLICLVVVVAATAASEEEPIVYQTGIQDAGVGTAGLADVAAEEDGQAGAQLGDASALECGQWRIDVGDAAATDDVAKAVDGQQAQWRVARVVHQADHGPHGGGGGGGQLGTRDVGGEFPRGGPYGAGAAGAVDELPLEVGVGGGRRAEG